MLVNTFEKIRKEVQNLKQVRANCGMELAVGYIYATYLEYLNHFEEYYDIDLPSVNQPVFDVNIININDTRECYFLQYKNSDKALSSKISAELYVGAQNINIDPNKVILTTYSANKSTSNSYHENISFVKIKDILDELEEKMEEDKENKHFLFLSDLLDKILFHIQAGYDFDSYYFDKLKAIALDKRKYSA